MNDDLKRMVEAILFAAARKLDVAEIAKLCKRSEADVVQVLSEWKIQLDVDNSPTMLVQDGTGWKLTVREKYVPVIKKVVTKTELPKGHMETLAIVAYKAPVLQSKVIGLRTNKAYDHLRQLEESGLIIREKKGRTKLIKLTPKFFEYFDVDPTKLKQKFASAGDVEKAIEHKEKEILESEIAQRKEAGERLEKPHLVLHAEKGGVPLQTYPAVEPLNELLPTGVEVVSEKVGDLDVYDVPLESIPEDERPHKHKVKRKKAHKKSEVELEGQSERGEVSVEAQAAESVPLEKPQKEHITPEQKIALEVEERAQHLKPSTFEEGRGLFAKGVPPEVEEKIDAKIRRMLEGEKDDGSQDASKDEEQ